MFEEPGKGCQGAVIEEEGRRYEFADHRPNSIYGLFGEIRYMRAYYVSTDAQGASWIPLDEQLEIGNRHPPGLDCFPSLFTGREASQKSLDRFHKYFRPDSKHVVSMRKALDMDCAPGDRIEGRRPMEAGGVRRRLSKMEKRD